MSTLPEDFARQREANKNMANPAPSDPPVETAANQHNLQIVSEATFLPSAAPSVCTHTIAALIGYLPEAHARQLLQNENLVDAPQSFADLHALWEGTQAHCEQLSKRKSSSSLMVAASASVSVNLDPLPAALRHRGEELRSQPMYARWYQGFAEYRVMQVPVHQLITPQWFADLDYIENLKQHAPKPGDLEAALDFVFDEGPTLPEPCLSGSGVAFRATHQRIQAVLPPIFRPSGNGGYEVVVRVEPIPNYLQVAKMGARLVIANGVHRATALMQAGWDRIPCLVRDARSLADLGLANQPGILPEAILLHDPRPPYLSDLFDPSIAPRFHQRSSEQVLRVIPQVDTCLVPKG